jgi:hypothetical protein
VSLTKINEISRIAGLMQGKIDLSSGDIIKSGAVKIATLTTIYAFVLRGIMKALSFDESTLERKHVQYLVIST